VLGHPIKYKGRQNPIGVVKQVCAMNELIVKYYILKIDIDRAEVAGNIADVEQLEKERKSLLNVIVGMRPNSLEHCKMLVLFLLDELTDKTSTEDAKTIKTRIMQFVSPNKIVADYSPQSLSIHQEMTARQMLEASISAVTS